MAAQLPTRFSRRHALGPRDANIFPLKQNDDNDGSGSGSGSTGSRRRSGGVCSKRTDNGRISKAARYYGCGRRVEEEEGRAGMLANQDLQEGGFSVATDSGVVGGGLYVPEAAAATTTTTTGFFDGRAISTSACAAAATTLRLRLRMALFKVQTNQTAVPISHLQLPLPLPSSVFQPSLAAAPGEVVEATVDGDNGGDRYYDDSNDNPDEDDNDDDDVTVSPPPSSPPPLMGIVYYTGRGIPFPTPMRSSSPSPSYGKPLDIGTSSIYGTSSDPFSSC